MKIDGFESSSISRIQFRALPDIIHDINKVVGFMEVVFKNGTTYIYDEVPLVSFLAVMNPSGGPYSVGSNFSSVIKSKNYKYRRV
jgi:hypothetical protein